MVGMLLKAPAAEQLVAFHNSRKVAAAVVGMGDAVGDARVARLPEYQPHFCMGVGVDHAVFGMGREECKEVVGIA